MSHHEPAFLGKFKHLRRVLVPQLVAFVLLLLLSGPASTGSQAPAVNALNPATDEWILDAIYVNTSPYPSLDINSISVGRSFKLIHPFTGETEATATLGGGMAISYPLVLN